MAATEQDYFFRQMDVNKDGAVSLKELGIQFKKHDIPLTPKFEERIPFHLKKLVSVDEDAEEFMSSDDSKGPSTELENKIRDAFKKLDHTLTKKGLTLFKVYTAYDGDKSGQLDIKEFSKILKRLDPGFTEEEVEIIFDLVDEDRSKTIEFHELNRYFCKVNGLPESLHAAPSDFKKKK